MLLLLKYRYGYRLKQKDSFKQIFIRVVSNEIVSAAKLSMYRKPNPRIFI